MSNKHMKRYSTLPNQEDKIKTIRYHFILARFLKILKSDDRSQTDRTVSPGDCLFSTKAISRSKKYILKRCALWGEGLKT